MNIWTLSLILKMAYGVATPSSCAMATPLVLCGISPTNSPKCERRLTIVPSPLVSLMNSLLYPSRPLVGTRYSSLVNPFSLFISCIRPFLRLSLEITEPVYSSGTDRTTSSSGSSSCPLSPRLMMTSGLDTASSYPPRLMFSMSMERCSSPLPDTLKLSVESVSSTFSPTLTSSSLLSLSLMCLDVTNLPTLPANGDLFTMKYMERVGSSMWIISSGIGSAGSQIVSPMEISEIPDITTMSPDSA